MKKNIMIIGAGVAGMAAAQTLAGRDVNVHIVEKKNRLGGHASKWACMATDRCQNCGACLSIEMADMTGSQENAVLHLNTGVKTLEKKGQGYEVTLENSTCFNAEKIIMATGFTPFDPDKISSLHHGQYKNVITTAKLNELLRQETVLNYFNRKKEPKIAFIQCVVSRNRNCGHDYCSQICCKTSMRQANKLNFLFPESDITIFHMDLQVIGKEIRTFYSTLLENITLTQGVPGEILENSQSNMLTIMREDPETKSRVSKEFDLVVLAVGMQPAPGLEKNCNILGIKPNSWGFFNTDQADFSKDVLLAGCAKGPKDILTSKQEGVTAAAKCIKQLGLDREKNLNIAVFGQGENGDAAAMEISSAGYKTFIFGPGKTLSQNSQVKILDETKIVSVKKTEENFSIFYKSKHEKKDLKCAAIIAALEPDLSFNTIKELKNSPLDLDAFSRTIGKEHDNSLENIIIVLDYFGPEFKPFARKALESALKAKEKGKNISIIMNKMLVHGAKGQVLYDSARQKGIDFFRFGKKEDLKFKDSGKGFLIQLKEATLPSIELDLFCDCLVLPPNLVPASDFKDTAELLGHCLDKEGFLQSANTRHRLTQSPRKGLFFVGTCHDETDQHDLNKEINAVISGIALNSVDLKKAESEVEINEKICAQCLTCIRVCPHKAIFLNEKNRPQIAPDSCFACHLCVSNCPAYAIESKKLSKEQIAQKIQKEKITILACQRSAALAAKNLSLPDNITLISIPCACRVSSDIILKALLNKASKVVVSGCHEENCRSIKGSRTAESSVKQVLSIPGIDGSKVVWQPIAANEEKKFENLVWSDLT